MRTNDTFDKYFLNKSTDYSKIFFNLYLKFYIKYKFAPYKMPSFYLYFLGVFYDINSKLTSL